MQLEVERRTFRISGTFLKKKKTKSAKIFSDLEGEQKLPSLDSLHTQSLKVILLQNWSFSKSKKV